MIDLPQIFTARQVVSITGVPYPQLDRWAKTKLLQPSICMASGSGSRRLYSRGDLFAIRVAWNLHKSGLFGAALRAALDYVCQDFDSFTRIERLGKDVIVRTGDESVSVLRKPGQLHLNFSREVIKAVSRVSERLQHLPGPTVLRKTGPTERMASSSKRSRRSEATAKKA